MFCMSNYRNCLFVNFMTFPKVSACYFSHFVTEYTPNNILFLIYITYIPKCTINQRILLLILIVIFMGHPIFILSWCNHYLFTIFVPIIVVFCVTYCLYSFI